MKKAALAIACLLLLAIAASLGTSYYFARHAEKKAAEWTKKFEEVAQYLKVSSEYKRGLLISTQRITIGLPVPGVKGGAEIVLKNVIHHGPFPAFARVGMATIEHSWEFDESAQKELAKAFGNGQPLAATTIIAFDGSGTTEFRGAPAAYSAGDDKLTWQGFTGTLRFTRDMESYSGELTAPQFSAGGKQGSANINGLAFRFDQRRMAGFEELYLGKLAFSMEAAAIKSDTGGGMVEKVVFESDASSADNQFVDIKAAFRIAKLASAEGDAADVEYAFSMRHLHAQSLMQLTKAMRETGARPDAAKADTAALMAQMEAMQKALALHGLALLKYEPVIAIDRINVKLKEGEIKAGATLRLPGVTEADMGQPFALLGKIDATATISIPEAFARNQYAQTKVRQAKAQLGGVGGMGGGGSMTDGQTTEVAAAAGAEFAQLLAGFGQAGYVERDGVQLKSRIVFKGGELTVNDKPFNPMAMMAPGAPPTMPPGAAIAAPPGMKAPFTPSPIAPVPPPTSRR